MRPVSGLRPGGPAPRRPTGPGPSKTVYRLTRVWKKAWVRRGALVVAPALALGLMGWQVASDPALVGTLAAQRAALVEALAARPEFALRGVRVTGASEPLAAAIRARVALAHSASALTTDVAAIREAVAALPRVRRAEAQLGTDGILTVAVAERVPEALWRDGEGGLWLVDRDGVVLDPAAARAEHPDLPVVLGADAPRAIDEALALFEAVPGLHARLRALIRVGGRRWDVALGGGQRILLPEAGAEAALKRVMAWHLGEDLLDRGVAAIDMRLPGRPTLRMTPGATELLRLRDALSLQAGKET